MAFDQTTRNLLQRTVAACRRLLDAEFAAQRRSIYGINDDGTVAPMEMLAHLADEDMQVAKLLRDRLEHLAAGLLAQGKKESEARREGVGRLTREQAFTVLNRLAALRMAEERGIVLECVRGGQHSEGFELFLQSAGGAMGGRFESYRAYIFLLFDELSADLGVLFNRWDPAGLLFPGHDALEAVLKELNGTGSAAAREDLAPEAFNAIWAEDETIGWIYQYYNDPDERKKMREESAAPRNSRELAVRNQFFTPRYVVEFLTDNTLGRIWYEMTKGKTRLAEKCRYLVRRPMEVFLAPRGDNDYAMEENDWVKEAALSGNFQSLPENPSLQELSRFALMIDGYQLMDQLEKRHGHTGSDGDAIQSFRDRVVNPQMRRSEKKPTPWQGNAAELWCGLFITQRSAWKEGWLSFDAGEMRRDHRATDDPVARDLWPALRDALRNPPTDLPKEELLAQTVYIPHRPIKDPREILMLDPACGSMHFGLYAFDLYEVIYQEAWAMGLVDKAGFGMATPPFPHESVRKRADAPTVKETYSGTRIDAATARVVLLSSGDTGDGLNHEGPYIREPGVRFRPAIVREMPLAEFDYAEALRSGWMTKEQGERLVRESDAFVCDRCDPLSAEEAHAAFLKDVPRLIIEHNIHGIDIDPRAAQIAGLSLWLRAQKTWQAMGLQPADRPRVRKSNIVCAEPMPGEKHLLAEFVQQEFQAAERPAFLSLLETVFDKMQLAGEAGSLLKIEEEIREAIASAKQQWKEGPKLTQATLFDEPKPDAIEQQRLALDLSGITDEKFWEHAEDRIYTALKDYAERSESGGFQRRLFAEDAARGFAFIDVCRKRYDVALMNPPFGDASKDSKNYLVRAYPITKNELYAAFVERGLNVIGSGALGAITSRTGFFQSSFQKWRTQILLPIAPPVAVADLGSGVLDGAMVETAAYCLNKASNAKRYSTFIRLGRESQKAEALCSALDAIGSAESHESIFPIDASVFQAIPGSPFAYWVPSSVRQLFIELPPFEADGRTVKQGLATADDFRFVRTAWEVAPSVIASKEGDLTAGKHWFPYPKGGEFSPFYADIPLVVNWESSGLQYWHNLSATGGVRSNIWMLNESVKQFFFQPGLTYPRRLHRLAVMPMPTGSIISVRGSGIYGKKRDLKRIAGLFSSAAFDFLVKCMLGRFGHPQFDNGTLCKTPIPEGFPSNGSDFEQPVTRALELKRDRDTANELSHVFCVPAIKPVGSDSLQDAAESWIGLGNATATEIDDLQAKIDGVSYDLYAFDSAGRNAVLSASTFGDESDDNTEDDDQDSDAVDAGDVASIIASYFSHFVGTAFGRWDIRFATGERQPPELPDPFDPLPVCPPGMLQNQDGLPARPEEVPGDYPVRIPWDGILVDDENNTSDIVARVREVLGVIWQDRSDVIEQEACSILGVKSLRDYFRRPAAFFADHLKRYSKSRRQAPIYWPLSTASGSYTLWIYYHRLDNDTLYKCLQNFLEPKMREVEQEIRRLRTMVDNKEGGPKERDRAEAQEGFLAELRDMHEILSHWAPRWKPNLNDGVIITACPLWKLFRLPKWRKDLEACWKKLEAGDYDWAHLAFTLWPDRVREKCKRDRSLAIAHNLEDICEIQAPVAKKKAAKKTKKNYTDNFNQED